MYSAEMGDLHPDAIFDLLEQVKSRAASTFTGLGLIFYASPVDLPIIELGDQSLFPQKLPISDRRLMASLLAEISTSQSPWHDGFHLIDANSFELTHVSHFLSPPVQFLQQVRSRGLPVGARNMAAMAGSKIPSVSYTALLSNKGVPNVFQHGHPLHREAVT